MPPRKTAIASAIGFALLLGASASQAAYFAYTSRTLFDAKLAQLGLLPEVHDFDALTPGAINVGGPYSYDGIFFDSAAINGGAFSVVDFPPAPPTTSNPNSLGTSTASPNQYQMLDGSTFSFSFIDSRALGLYVISTDTIEIGDFELSFGTETVQNSNVGIPVQAPNQFAYFLGIIDDAGVHSDGTFAATDYPGFDVSFLVDDIVTTPVPATLGLFGLGLLMLRRQVGRNRA